MGVDGLIGFVKLATTQTKITDIGISGKNVAVDISHWMYKASYACPEILYHRTQMHHAYAIITNYIDNYVRLLRKFNVKLTMVFDGMRLPAKQVTHRERHEKKAEARKLVVKYLANGNEQEARKHMPSCVELTFDIVEAIIKYCKNNDLDYMIAPYEADAQLAFLGNNGICDFIITEDTDLILYGCNKIIYKLDTSGNCLFYEKSKLHKCLGPRGDSVDFDRFRRMCIMSGCDYLKNIPSVGLQKAKKFFLMTHQDNLSLLLPKLATYLKAPKLAGKVTKEYIEAFIQAESTFRHHIVYDPRTEKVRPLEPYPKGHSWKDYPLAGKPCHHVLANDLVRGKINLDSVNECDLDSESDNDNDDNDDDHGD